MYWSSQIGHDRSKKVKKGTVESRFFEPPGEKEIGSNYREIRQIGGKITVFDW